MTNPPPRPSSESTPPPAQPSGPIPVSTQPTMRLIGPLGTELLLPTSSNTFYEDRRRYGKRGFTDPGDLTHHPLELPRCMVDFFDWTLIGCREFMSRDETGQPIPAVDYRGRVYKRRDLPGNKKLKLPEGDVKYSRGAKAGEEQIASGASGENAGYVTLVFFRSKGPPLAEFCKPGTFAQAQAVYQADRVSQQAMPQASD
ncbi:single-stranded DNA-binding protein [Deinococcus ruber]|uniref:Single-stranded DNA-binding protein DdrB n=1 Tax=Deinococcus ruber TaxID=1848197 RepID=A0A918CGI5_9DEIO|nr:single-stranded DNA-binding protein [Deinococcus ruber]GGR21232.1 single-stranded DNA-binding protein DdrB [Deinococcus ruber]